jgi:hypothetical protein
MKIAGGSRSRLAARPKIRILVRNPGEPTNTRALIGGVVAQALLPVSNA